jgi:hypothetical protein
VKKGTLCSIVALALVLGLVLSMVTPVMASMILGSKITTDVPAKYYIGSIIHYQMTVINPSINTETNTLKNIYDTLPGGSIYWFVKEGVNPPLVQAPGNSMTYSLNYTVNAADLIVIPDGPNAGRYGVLNYFDAHGSDSKGDPVDVHIGKNSVVLRPAINITKTVDCNDDGVYSKTETTTGPSDDADWKVVVTNTGFDPVYNITVTDTNGHSFGAKFDLAANATKTFTYTTTISATTTNTATAVGKDEIGGTVGPVSDSATNNIITIQPNTVTTIAANATTVPINGKVSLTVTEKNTGGVNLTTPRVEVRQNGVLIATLNKASAYYAGGDTSNPGVLNPGETWRWNNISSNPINATTTFEARGFGTDSQGHEVSYATGYLGERAVVIVNTRTVGWETYPIDKVRVLLPWIALLAATMVGASLLVLRHRRAQN